MGKQSHRKSRRKRHKPEPDRSSLRLTVGVTPRTNRSGQPTLGNELRLLRSSLLYADHVNLVAPSTQWLGTFSPLQKVDINDPWDTVAALPAETLQRMGVEGIAYRDFRRTMRKLGKLPADHPQRIEGENHWRPAIAAAMQQIDAVFDSAEWAELDMAVQAGSVTLISDGTRFENPVDQQIKWFRDRLVDALADPGSSVLLDGEATTFLRESGKYEDGLPNVVDHRTRRASVGTGLVERLPTFPDAQMSQVLEAREELSEGRARYRASVKSFAGQLQSSALDPTLSSEISELWHDEVRPTLEDLRRMASKTRIAVETGKRLVTEGYGLPTLAVTIANVPDLAAMLPTPAAAIAAVGRLAAAGAHEAFQKRAEVQNHDLVYLLDVNKRLSVKKG